MTTNKNEKISICEAFKLCLPIAVIIFITAFLSDLSIKFISAGENNVLLGVLMDFVGIMIITGVLMFMVIDSKKYRKMITRIFASDESEVKQVDNR